MNTDEKRIAQVLSDYEQALNESDTDAVMKLYASDGVFMPQHLPSSVGKEAVRRAYEGVFQIITLKVKFSVAEIRQVSEEWAFARTNSAGTTTLNANGKGGPEANQELFIFQKSEDSWKIARYCFSTTNPPA